MSPHPARSLLHGQQDARGNIETCLADQVLGLPGIQSVQRIDAQCQCARRLRRVSMHVDGRVGQHLGSQSMGGGIECAHAFGLDFQQACRRWSRQFMASGLARHAHQPGADDAVVQELAVAVEQGPPEAGTRQQQAEQGKEKAQHGLIEGQGPPSGLTRRMRQVFIASVCPLRSQNALK